MMVAFAASAQNVEQDDMYFRSKDRALLAATKPLTYANTLSRASEVNSPINPTDSYSARNVNPEYISQTKVNPSATTQSGGVTYFIPNYTPTSVNQNIYNNPANWNYYGSGFRPSYYGMNSMMGYGMMSGFGNPYYNSFYSPYSSFGSPYSYYDPFGYNSFGYNGFNNFYGYPYGSGLSLSMGMGFGYGGFNNYWGNSFYNNFWGGGYNPYYGNNVIIVTGDSNGNNVVYGKRSSRSNDLNNTVTSGNRSATVNNSSQSGGRSSTSGRVASTSDSNVGSYYQRGWRSNPETNTRSAWSNSGSTSSNTSPFFTNSNTTRSNSTTDFNNNSSRSWSGGNTSSNVSTGGSRSSVGSVGGGSSSSSGGARRGRD